MRRILTAIALLGVLVAMATPASASSTPTLDAWHGVRAAAPALPSALFHTGAAPSVVRPTLAPNTGAGTPLGFQTLQSMVVDDGSSQVFLTGLDANSSTWQLRGFTFNGTALTLPDETDARGLALSGGNLYVARCVDQVVDVIDTATLTKVDSIPISNSGTNSGDDFCDIGIAGGKIWYPPSDGVSDLTSITLAAPHTQVSYPAFQFTNPQYSTLASHPNLLVVSGTAGGDSLVFDLSSGDAVQTGTLTGIDFAHAPITPDAASILVAAGDGIDQVSLTADEVEHVYPIGTGNMFHGAVSSDGKFVAVSSNQSGVAGSPADVTVYPAGTSTARRQYRLPEGDATEDTRIGFSGTTSKLFVATGFAGSTSAFHVLAHPTAKASKLTLSAPRGIKYGSTANVTATLKGGKTNKTVKIWALPYGKHSGTVVAHGKVNRKGHFTAKLKPKKNTTFWATYDGDASWQPSISSGHRTLVHVVVKGKLSGYYATSGRNHLFHSSSRILYSATVTPPHRGACITFVLEIKTSSGWRYGTACFAQNRRGTAAVIVRNPRLGRQYRIGAAFTDPAHAPGGTTWSYFEVTH